MSLTKIQLPPTKTIISTAASVAATAMLVRSISKEFIPPELQHYLLLKFRTFLCSFSSQLTLVIEEYEGFNHNHLFHAAELYLGTIISSDTHIFRVTLPQKEKKIAVSMERNQEINDNFNGVALKWKFVSKQSKSSNENYSALASEIRRFELSFHKKHKKYVFDIYLPYLLNKSKEVKEERKTQKLFTLKDTRIRRGNGNPWQPVNLDHPATFDTLAMEMEMKRSIIDDLERFVKRKEYYRRVGKAWKRGYLLFGPPGTGKTSLIAAIANYLHFDIYDLELANLRSNSELRRLLTETANQSILVVEDIDCSVELQNRSTQTRAIDPFRSNQGPQVTLSGMLNFIDGLWSSAGDERIIVFTTNHKDRLDPALLRPGRMDLHIHLSYCTPCGFKILASNYLGITQHPLFSEVEQLMETMKVTPAEVSEQLMKIEEPETALRGLIEFLREKKERDEATARAAALKASEAEAKQESKGENLVNTEATVAEKRQDQ